MSRTCNQTRAPSREGGGIAGALRHSQLETEPISLPDQTNRSQEHGELSAEIKCLDENMDVDIGAQRVINKNGTVPRIQINLYRIIT